MNTLLNLTAANRNTESADRKLQRFVVNHSPVWFRGAMRPQPHLTRPPKISNVNGDNGKGRNSNQTEALATLVVSVVLVVLSGRGQAAMGG